MAECAGSRSPRILRKIRAEIACRPRVNDARYVEHLLNVQAVIKEPSDRLPPSAKKSTTARKSRLLFTPRTQFARVVVRALQAPPSNDGGETARHVTRPTVSRSTVMLPSAVMCPSSLRRVPWSLVTQGAKWNRRRAAHHANHAVARRADLSSADRRRGRAFELRRAVKYAAHALRVRQVRASLRVVELREKEVSSVRDSENRARSVRMKGHMVMTYVGNAMAYEGVCPTTEQDAVPQRVPDGWSPTLLTCS